MKVDPDSKQCPCDGHESLAVVIWIQSKTSDSLVDGIYEERINT